jgi:hypothetical protein
VGRVCLLGLQYVPCCHGNAPHLAWPVAAVGCNALCRKGWPPLRPLAGVLHDLSTVYDNCSSGLLEFLHDCRQRS